MPKCGAFRFKLDGRLQIDQSLDRLSILRYPPVDIDVDFKI